MTSALYRRSSTNSSCNSSLFVSIKNSRQWSDRLWSKCIDKRLFNFLKSNYVQQNILLPSILFSVSVTTFLMPLKTLSLCYIRTDVVTHLFNNKHSMLHFRTSEEKAQLRNKITFGMALVDRSNTLRLQTHVFVWTPDFF